MHRPGPVVDISKKQKHWAPHSCHVQESLPDSRLECQATDSLTVWLVCQPEDAFVLEPIHAGIMLLRLTLRGLASANLAVIPNMGGTASAETARHPRTREVNSMRSPHCRGCIWSRVRP